MIKDKTHMDIIVITILRKKRIQWNHGVYKERANSCDISNGFHARERNMGWRIDYIFVSQRLENEIEKVEYLKEQLGSEYCPCFIQIKL